MKTDPARRAGRADRPRAPDGLRRASTCWSCPGRRPARPGPTSRSPKAATGGAGSARSRRSVASSARGRSASILAEIEALEAREIVLVAQDLASYGRDRTAGASSATSAGPGHRRAHRGGRAASRAGPPALSLPVLAHRPARRGDRRRPASPTSTSPCSTPPAACCARCAAGETRAGSSSGSDGSARLEPGAAFRSSFILGYPGETEEDHDELLRFIEEAELDWAGFFTFSREDGHARRRARRAGPELARPRAPPGVLGAAGGDHGRRRRRSSSGRPARCSSTGPAVPARTGKPRDRRHRARAALGPGGLARRGPRHRRGRARPRGGCRAADARRRGGAMSDRDTVFGPVGSADARERAHARQVARLAGHGRARHRHRAVELAAGRPLVRLLVLGRPRRRDRKALRHDALGSVPGPARRQVHRPRRAGRAGGNRRGELAAGDPDRGP